jgi:hypothetical protein
MIALYSGKLVALLVASLTAPDGLAKPGRDS